MRCAFSISTLRLRAQSGAVETAASGSATTATYKPYFSLSTNRTYGTADRARVWINYVGIDHLDFRVYRVADPVKFFKSLDDPHQMGEGEKTQIISGLNKRPVGARKESRTFKVSIFKSIKDYFRNQLRRGTRESLNQKLNRRRRSPAAQRRRLCARAAAQSRSDGQQLARKADPAR